MREPTEADGASLAAYLASFAWPGRDPETATALIASGLPLWRHLLSLVPASTSGGRALEIGSPPFHTTLLLQRLRSFRITPSAAAVDARRTLVHEATSVAFGETHRFACECFDVEHDRFPFPDGHFALVLWSEVIEHLTEDPVHALAEIHRVLAPGGTLVVSTPNAGRADNVRALLRGDNVYDPYHLGSPLRGSRHSREYTAPELRRLLEGCGFTIDRLDAVDLRRPSTRTGRVVRHVLRGLGHLTGAQHAEHLFVRALRTTPTFCWSHPPDLFDAGHLVSHLAPRDRDVTMGVNDAIHTTAGWGPLHVAAGRAARSCRLADVHLAPGETRHVVLTVLGAGAEVVVSERGASGRTVAWERIAPATGGWREVTIGCIPAGCPEGVHVRIDAPDGLAVHRIVAG